MTERRHDPLAIVGSLQEPNRRALYRFVARSRGPVTREDAAKAVRIGLSLATFHLERLRRDGLIDVAPAPTDRRTRGRPAKRYRRGRADVGVQVPPRNYELAARVLATAVRRDWDRARAGVLHAARDAGRRAGELAQRSAARRSGRDRFADAALDALEELAYEPQRDGDAVRLANCPYRAIAAQDRELACGLSTALIGGLLERLPDAKLRLRADPGADPGAGCCVVLERHATST